MEVIVVRAKNLAGFVFSLDALFAVLVAVTAIAAVASVAATTKTSAYGAVSLNRAAQDALTLMDKQDVLRAVLSQADADVNEMLEDEFPSYVPVNMGAHINITIYSYNDPGFTITRSFAKEVGRSAGDEAGEARRVFADPANNRFGLAVIRVWYK